MRKFIQTSLLIIISSYLISSCQSDDNNSYSTKDVDAFSKFIKVKPNNWQFDSDGPRHFVKYSIPEINENVINRGIVLVYMAEIGTTANRWRLIPRTEVYFNKDKDSILYTVEWGFWVEPGILELEYFKSKDWEIAPSHDTDIKVVVLDDMSEYESYNVNFEDFDEVSKIFKLKASNSPNILINEKAPN